MRTWTKDGSAHFVTTLSGKAVQAHTLAPAVLSAGDGHAGTGGIQAHSLGETFPLAVVGVGDTWRVWNPETGDEFLTTDSVYDAWRECRELSACCRLAAIQRHRELRFARREDFAAEAALSWTVAPA